MKKKKYKYEAVFARNLEELQIKVRIANYYGWRVKSGVVRSFQFSENDTVYFMVVKKINIFGRVNVNR